ncbi:unnamed protein product [Caenorhabditis bovis]|uniref:Potassium channel domain-containing protein n=1 Tax=Caenorhabditis bovis TaxID=2654633 RepID=A0A8S1EDU3_9PELO|nr:unnamed protein product [Caenorhabditis bovis]
MSLLSKRETYPSTQQPSRSRHRETAIDIEGPDEISSENVDIETGLSNSRCRLMYNFEEERPTSLAMSLHESARSSVRKAKYYFSYYTRPLKKIIGSLKLLIIIALYSFLGAHLFMYLEVPTDIEEKTQQYHKRLIAREVMILNLRAIHYENKENREERWKNAIINFENDLELDEPEIATVWTFWMSFLYAGTIFTTIGYGNISCKTRAGQIATMVYAFCGIPIMLLMLSSLNNFLLKWIKILTNWCSDLILYIGVRTGIISIRQDEVQKRLRYASFLKKMHQLGFIKEARPTSIMVSQSEEDHLNSGKQDEEEEGEIEETPPVYSTLFATVSWIMLSAAVFCLFEEWSYFTSFYFCFISLTTIGLGDVTPANPEYMIATFGVVLVGLSMLTVCIDVIKEKIAQMYMALLQKLLKDYMEAVKNGDPNAATTMMAGFQGKAKFLMPLISKNEGTKVMNKFKENCSKKGIDPPAVLTDINLETGMPNFVSASRDEFNDYIEVAEKRHAEEINQNQTSSRRPSLPKMVSTCGASTQAGHGISDIESSDEGIQTDWSDSEVACQTFTTTSTFGTQFGKPLPLLVDSFTQYEILKSASVGIQPEVSSIYLANDFDDDESDPFSDYETDSESGEEKKEDDVLVGKQFMSETRLQSQGLSSPPIEIDPVESDRDISQSTVGQEDENTLPIPLKMAKSGSIDSAETVIHMGESPDAVSSLQRQSKMKRRKRREKSKKNHELRFLKSSGNQASPIIVDSSTQYEVFVVDASIETILVEKRNRRCQTKLASINREQLHGFRESIKRKKNKASINRSDSTESDFSSRASNFGDEVEQISVDLSIISVGVNEKGEIVDPVLLSDEEDILSLDNLEMFAKNSSMQTETREMLDKQETSTECLVLSDSAVQTSLELTNVAISPIDFDNIDNWGVLNQDNADVQNGPLWSDFDYVAATYDEDGKQIFDFDESKGSLFDEEEPHKNAQPTTDSAEIKYVPVFEEISVQTESPEYENIAVQTSFNVDPPEVENAGMQTSQVLDEPEYQSSDISDVERRRQTEDRKSKKDEELPQSKKKIKKKLKKKVYVKELDEERRLNMSDIGIQTGVLARVQHIYTLPMSDESAQNAGVNPAAITVRKSSESSEVGRGSSESLALSVPTLSNSESLDEKTWAGTKTNPFTSRGSSLKLRKTKTMQDVERKIDKTNLVQEIRARFESKSPTPPTDDGQSSSSKK